MQETIIIGAGIAGMTAAIYAARKKMDYLLISEDFGGQMNSGGEIVNYPGIIKTTGVKFSTDMQKQLKFNKVKIKEEKVEDIESIGNDNYKVHTNKGSYETKTIIIATGARPRKIHVDGEDKFANKGVTYCAVCDGPIFTGKDVVVIGGGNAGLEAVDFMLNIAKKITIIDVAEESVAHEYLQDKILKNPKVEYINKSDVVEIYGDKFVKGLKYDREGTIIDLKVGGVIIEIGRIPNTEIFKDIVEIDEHGHIVIGCSGETDRPGLFAAGDCASGHEYQYVIAAGQGCMALLKAARYLAKKK